MYCKNGRRNKLYLKNKKSNQIINYKHDYKHGQKYVDTPSPLYLAPSASFISELLFISQSRKPDQLVSPAADRLETSTAASSLPGCPFIAAQPSSDQSPITIQSIDWRILSLCPCLFSAGAVCAGRQSGDGFMPPKNTADKKEY